MAGQNNRQTGTSDISAEVDGLGIEEYARGVADYIRTCETPMTLSIQGSWGSGKTSFFNLVEKALKKPGNKKLGDNKTEESNRDYVNEIIGVAHINTWQYSVMGYDGVLILLLLAEMVEDLDLGCWDAMDEVKNRIKWLFSSAGRLLYGRLSNGVEVQEMQKDEDFSDLEKLPKAFKEMKDQLVKALEETAKTKKKNEDKARAVIFIDDLDRLDPIDAVSLMEGIKNLLDCKRCVFVLAIDQDVVFEGVKAKYGEELGERRKQMFFEKLIQVPFYLPINAYDVKKYVKTIVGEKSGGDVDNMAKVVESLVVSKNPREIKRCFNLASMYKCVIPELEQTDQANCMLLMATILKMHYPFAMGELCKRLQDTTEEGKAADFGVVEDDPSETDVAWLACQKALKALDLKEKDQKPWIEALVKCLKQIEERTASESEPVDVALNRVLARYGLRPEKSEQGGSVYYRDRTKVALVNKKVSGATLTLYRNVRGVDVQHWKVFLKQYEEAGGLTIVIHENHATFVLDDASQKTREFAIQCLETYLSESLV